MSGVTVTLVNVIGVITVRDGVVPAAGPMNMIMAVVGGVRARVLDPEVDLAVPLVGGFAG